VSSQWPDSPVTGDVATFFEDNILTLSLSCVGHWTDCVDNLKTIFFTIYTKNQNQQNNQMLKNKTLHEENNVVDQSSIVTLWK
jgi:hypothetical protein